VCARSRVCRTPHTHSLRLPAKQGWLGTAGLTVALLLAPGLGGFDMAAPSAKTATTVVKAPSQADLARAKLEDARKAQYTAKRAALEAKQTADQAAAQAKVSMAKASKAAAAVAKEPDSYEGLLQKATTTSTPAAAVTVAKVEEKVAVDAEAASKAAASKEAAAKATAEKASAALADALKAELKTVS
jgi:flagellar motor protein MotB